MTDPNLGDLDPYTPAAREVVESALAHAAALGHGAADTAHLLFGLVTDAGAGMAAVILREIPAEPAAIRHGIEARLGRGDRRGDEPVPFSAAARRALDLAVRENPVAGSPLIGTDHVLLGLLAESGFAAEVLVAHGVTAERFRAAHDRIRSRQCYGCAEYARQAWLYEVSEPTLPNDLEELITQVAELRQAKEEAVDAEDWERAADIRTREKDALRRAVTELDEHTAKARLTAALNEIMRLRTEVGRPAGLLRHRHSADGRKG